MGNTESNIEQTINENITDIQNNINLYTDNSYREENIAKYFTNIVLSNRISNVDIKTIESLMETITAASQRNAIELSGCGNIEGSTLEQNNDMTQKVQSQFEKSVQLVNEVKNEISTQLESVLKAEGFNYDSDSDSDFDSEYWKHPRIIERATEKTTSNRDIYNQVTNIAVSTDNSKKLYNEISTTYNKMVETVIENINKYKSTTEAIVKASGNQSNDFVFNDTGGCRMSLKDTKISQDNQMATTIVASMVINEMVASSNDSSINQSVVLDILTQKQEDTMPSLDVHMGASNQVETGIKNETVVEKDNKTGIIIAICIIVILLIVVGSVIAVKIIKKKQQRQIDSIMNGGGWVY